MNTNRPFFSSPIYLYAITSPFFYITGFSNEGTSTEDWHTIFLKKFSAH